MVPSDRPGGLSEGTFFSNHPETFRICSRYHLEEIACTNFGDFKKMYSILKILDLRARVAEGRPAFRDHITRRSQESKIVYRGVGADFEIQKNIFG